MKMMNQHTKIMHAFWIVVTLGLSLTGLPASWAQSESQDEVTVPDASLRAVLEDSLGLSAGEPITAASLSKLTALEAPDKGIVDLTGLDSATGLTRLNLGPVDTGDPWANRNAISDLSPLSGLTGLTWLHLAGNSVADVTPLSGLTGLTFLNLQVNEITDADSLSGLTGLTDLYLAFNPLQDASSLSGLTDVTVYDLPRPPRHPKLGSSLSRQVGESEGSSSEGRSARGQGHQGSDSVVPVRIRTNSRDSVDTVARFLDGQGISSDTWRSDGGSGVQGLLWAHVPLRLLVRLSEQPGVISVREVLEAIPHQGGSGTPPSTPSTITAAPAHGATAWREAGIRGAGIKVGVIDVGGFDDFQARMTQLGKQSTSWHTYCFSGPDAQAFDGNNASLANCGAMEGVRLRNEHGTNVTQALLDIAPDVELYIRQAGPHPVGERGDGLACDAPFKGPASGSHDCPCPGRMIPCVSASVS